MARTFYPLKNKNRKHEAIRQTNVAYVSRGLGQPEKTATAGRYLVPDILVQFHKKENEKT